MSGPIIVTVLALVAGACSVPISKWIWRELFEADDIIATSMENEQALLKQLEKRGASIDYLEDFRNLTGT